LGCQTGSGALVCQKPDSVFRLGRLSCLSHFFVLEVDVDNVKNTAMVNLQSAADANFLMNCWYVAAWDHELIDGKKLARTILEKPVVLYQGESGKIVALDDRCCHRGAALSLGRIEGDCIRCMYHGLKFDTEGVCIDIPGQERIPSSFTVYSYPVEERNHLVWIWMGDPALADPELIVDYEPLGNPAWRGLPGYLHYDANYFLIVDNLSDLGHLAFVHTNTLGGSEDYAYVSKPISIERHPWGFRIERWHHDVDLPPYHRKVVPEKDAKVDRRNITQMRVPGIFLMETLFSPAGSGAEDLEGGARQYRNCQYMTPETRCTTHFFWNYLHNYDLDNPNIAISLKESLTEGFFEDKHIIEAQQVLLDNDPDFKLRVLAADEGLTHFRLRMKKLIDEERASVQTSVTQG
jgi:phenylpropionate dioxygenase-like ring-hydroxylating dioxygenase large terminal subunit